MTQQLQQLPVKTALHTCRRHVPAWHSSFYRFEQLRRLLSAQIAAQLCTLPMLLLILGNAAAAPALATADRCAPSDGLNYICGLTASEDLVRVPGVNFAEGMGVDATQIPAALAGGRADSRILQEFMAKMARRDFSPTGRIDNMLKDLETVQAAAMGRRVPMPVTSLITDLHRMLVAGGLGAADSAEYMRLFDLAADRDA
jgi:NAD-binding of NADP-dependent 3-hydroxyisobutyrate dehydrogenase